MLWIELQMVLSQHDHYRGDDDESAIVDTDVVTMSTAAGQSRVCVNINKSIFIYFYLFIYWELTLWINTSVDPANCMTQQVPARCVDIVTGIPVKGFV